MDKQTAKNKLRELRDSLSKVLDDKNNQDFSEDIEQAQESARQGAKALKKSLIERIKDLPVVTQVSQLGAAGTVAVSTAAVTQVDIAVDRTEVFVAEVANDVIEERFEVPTFIDTFVDFDSLNDWGQQVIIDKVSEAQAFVSEASEQRQIPIQSSASQDSKSASSASSQDASSDKSSQPSKTESNQESEQKGQESKEDKSSEKNGNEKKDSTKSNTEVKEEGKKESKENSQEQDNKGKQGQSQESKTEDMKESQSKSSSESDGKSEGVKPLPVIETPFEPMNDDIKPHSSIRQVSPVS